MNQPDTYFIATIVEVLQKYIEDDVISAESIPAIAQEIMERNEPRLRELYDYAVQVNEENERLKKGV